MNQFTEADLRKMTESQLRDIRTVAPGDHSGGEDVGILRSQLKEKLITDILKRQVEHPSWDSASL